MLGVMQFRHASSRIRHGVAAMVCAASAAWLSLPVQASLVGPITVTLNSPGGYTDGSSTNPAPLLFTDTVAVAVGIHPGDGSNIGGFMLSSEFIEFGGATEEIRLRVAAGADTNGVLTSGYLGSGGVHARYEFSGLSIAGEVITGFSVTGSGFTFSTDLTSLIHFNAGTPGSLFIDLDTMIFTDPGTGTGDAGGNLVINLLTRACAPTEPGCNGDPPNPTPEPASLALVLAGLLAMRRGLRGRSGR